MKKRSLFAGALCETPYSRSTWIAEYWSAYSALAFWVVGYLIIFYDKNGKLLTDSNPMFDDPHTPEGQRLLMGKYILLWGCSNMAYHTTLWKSMYYFNNMVIFLTSVATCHFIPTEAFFSPVVVGAVVFKLLDVVVKYGKPKGKWWPVYVHPIWHLYAAYAFYTLLQ